MYQRYILVLICKWFLICFLGTNISSTMPSSSLHPVLQFRGLNFEEELDEYQETSTNRGNMFNSKSMYNESPIVDNLILQRSRNNSNDRYNTKSSKVINEDEVIIRSQFLSDWVDVPSYLRYNYLSFPVSALIHSIKSLSFDYSNFRIKGKKKCLPTFWILV